MLRACTSFYHFAAQVSLSPCPELLIPCVKEKNTLTLYKPLNFWTLRYSIFSFTLMNIDIYNTRATIQTLNISQHKNLFLRGECMSRSAPWSRVSAMLTKPPGSLICRTATTYLLSSLFAFAPASHTHQAAI